MLNRGDFLDLNNRKLVILSLIAKGYLKTGEPVGSKSLVSELGGAVSSATIRNDMADLERQGLVFQPHTSAGRIPTSLGLTLYIDRLMEKRRLSKQRRELIDSLFSSVFSIESAFLAASNALADYTQCVSFSAAPSVCDTAIKQIDFIKSGENAMIFVILTETNQVKSVYVNLFGALTDSALSSLKALAEKRIVGRLLSEISKPFIQTLAAELNEYSLLFSPFFEALLNTVNELAGPEVLVKGQNNLLKSSVEKASVAKALDFLNSEQLLGLLSPKNSVKILIPEGESTAIIYSGYHFSDSSFGAIGILGPNRLDYGSLIPMIEYFSSSLENMIKKEKLYK